MNKVRVATLNIWNRLGLWERRLEVIRVELARLAPDVIGLQEVIHLQGEHNVNQAAEVAEGLGYHIAIGRGADGPPWGLCNAILSKWPITRSLVFTLPGTDEARCVVFAELDSPAGKLPLFSTHLNWKLDEGHVRAQQVRALASFVESVAPARAELALPPIVVGDFNAEPDSDEIRFMRGLTSLGGQSVYFGDCFAVAGDGSKGATYSRRNPHAGALREPERRIDYVFVRGPDEKLRGEPVDAALCFHQPVGDIWASDHFGVVATIST